MKQFFTCSLFLFVLLSCQSEKADVILYNAEIHTMEEDGRIAKSIAIAGNEIIGVYTNTKKALRHSRDHTLKIDLDGKFVMPGFIDAHVHFNRAGSLIKDANLMAVADDAGLIAEIKRLVSFLEPGEWITGGLWGAYEQWSLGAASGNIGATERWRPNRWLIDDLTWQHPCMLNSFDYQYYLANTAALEAAGLINSNIPGMEIKDGIPTGLITRGSPAIQQIRKLIKPKSHQRLLEENKAALQALARAGIVEIHDIAVPDQTQRFVELQESGELSCRVWLRPDLSRGAELAKSGLTMGLHPQTKKQDGYLRYGALKGYIDGIMGTHGALFYEPYNDQPDNYGHYRRHTSDDKEMMEPNMEKMYELITTGYEAGFVSNVHAIGTKGVSLMLDTYERLGKELNHSLDGFRVIHAQVIKPTDFERFKSLNVIAEVNPYHISDDMRWMEERIGQERCKGAYAFKSLIDNGALLSFGSDWPGTSAAEYHMHPKYLLHAAVNRTTLNGEPEGGWYPEQKISIYDALKAYTINNAIACFEGEKRGSLKKGKLADLVVCNLNLMEIPSDKLLDLEILMTMVDGKIVYQAIN